jgi:putative ABC transport system permease protein
MTTSPGRRDGLSIRAFRLLVGLYPGAFRDEYGRELALVFADRYRDAAGTWARTRLWVDALTGIVVEAAREHWRMVLQDLRYASRMLRRHAFVTTTIMTTLGLGIGANTAIFSVVHALMLRALPVQDPGRLVELLSRYPGEPRMNNFGWTNYEHYRDRNHVFSDLIGTSPARFQVTGHGTDAPEHLDGEYVVGRYFPALGVRAALGRLIEPEDDQLVGRDPAVVVVSWRLWRRRFDLDSSIVGRRLTVNGVPATIVGVASRDFSGLQVGRTSDVWVPAAMEPLVESPSRRADGSLRLHLVGRLKPGVSIDEARAELRVLDRVRVEEIATKSHDPQWRKATLELEPAASGLSGLRDRFGRPLLMLMAIVALLLVLACTNIASILAARASERQREMAIRRVLGAGRVRLVRQLLTESLLLSGAGGLLGIVLAYVAAGALVRSLPVDPRSRIERYDIPLEPDAHVLLFTAAAALLTAVLFGLAPSWKASEATASSSLHEIGSVAEPRSRRLFGKGLVVAQVALSVVVLSAALMLVGHVADLRDRDVGFERTSVLLVTLDPSRSGHSPDELLRVYQGLLGRLESIPGVRSVSLAAVTPIQGGAASQFMSVEGFHEQADDRRRVSLNWVSPRYFDTVGTPRIEGRDFVAQDEHAPRVAVVNQRLARHYFGEESPIGKRFTLEKGSGWYEIIGVVADAKYASLQEPAPPTIYLHAFQEARGSVSQFALRTDVPPASVAGDVRRAVSEASPAVTVARIRTLAEQVDASIVVERLLATLSSAFAGLGALLAAIGLYGLLAYTVARRTNEIGIRMALGATTGDVTRTVLGSALILVAFGVALGLPLAFWIQQLGDSLIANFGAALTVPVVAAAAMVTVGLIAAYVPARRAARVHPAEALRHS